MHAYAIPFFRHFFCFETVYLIGELQSSQGTEQILFLILWLSDF